MRSRFLFVLCALVIAGCAGDDAADADAAPADTMTREERDSAIARSRLPGASTVGRAQDVAGDANDRAAQLDSIQ